MSGRGKRALHASRPNPNNTNNKEREEHFFHRVPPASFEEENLHQVLTRLALLEKTHLALQCCHAIKHRLTTSLSGRIMVITRITRRTSWIGSE